MIGEVTMNQISEDRRRIAAHKTPNKNKKSNDSDHGETNITPATSQPAS
jgi:hypothetical protein